MYKYNIEQKETADAIHKNYKDVMRNELYIALVGGVLEFPMRIKKGSKFYWNYISFKLFVLNARLSIIARGVCNTRGIGNDG